MNTQQKFLERVQDEAEVRGLVMVNDKDFSNTGTIRFEKAESFAPIVTFGYQFHQGYAQFFGDLGNPSQRTAMVGARTVKFDELDGVLDVLRSLLPGGRKA